MSRHELTGWLLFTVSACCFVVSCLRSGDIPGLIGSVLFLVACLFFILPLRGAAGRRK